MPFPAFVSLEPQPAAASERAIEAVIVTVRSAEESVSGDMGERMLAPVSALLGGIRWWAHDEKRVDAWSRDEPIPRYIEPLIRFAPQKLGLAGHGLVT